MSVDLVKLFDLTKKQYKLLIRFEQLICEWNKKINLVSRKDINNFKINHIAHSLSISLYFKFKNGTEILDLGTGGGLPGIPLAIIFPNVNFHLIDKVGKKIDVVTNIVRNLKLRNVKTSWINVKKINNRYDFVISRSVSSYDKILKNCESIFLSDNQNEFENGFILFKGGDLRNEFKNVNNFYTHEIFNKINLDFFNEKKLVHIPNPYNHT